MFRRKSEYAELIPSIPEGYSTHMYYVHTELVCNLCGAWVADTRKHDEWHWEGHPSHMES